MLIITRKKAQKIIIADDIEITILDVGRNRVRFGINAPKQVTIHTHLKDSIASAPSIRAVEDRPSEPEEDSEPRILPAAVGFSSRR